jgi:hypothetical protein
MKHIKRFQLFEEAPPFDMEHPEAKGLAEFSQMEKDKLKRLGADVIDDYKITFNEMVESVENRHTGEKIVLSPEPIEYRIHVTKTSASRSFYVEFECFDRGRQSWRPMYILDSEISSEPPVATIAVSTIEGGINVISSGISNFEAYCKKYLHFDIVNLSPIFDPKPKKFRGYPKFGL